MAYGELGAGLRLRECLKLRVKDVDFEYRQIIVRTLHDRDLVAGYGDVELPDALRLKYPKAVYD